MRILCVGEMMVDLLVHPVSDIQFHNDASVVENISITSGGDANNNAIDLSKLGNQVYYVGLAGKDPLADHCLQIARSAGVCVDYVKRSSSLEQTKSLILIDEKGDRCFLQYPGTSAAFSLDDVDLSLLKQVDILQIGGTFHLPKFDGEGACTLLQAAQEQGVLTCMDVTKDPTGRWDEIIHCCYPYLDYFLPSIDQAACIAKTRNEQEIADYFLRQGVKNVVIKMGEQGCYCKSADRAFYCGCYHVPVMEPTGAGDAFVAGFLTAVGKGSSFENCVLFATAVSAHAVQAYGATSGIPDYETVLAFMKAHDAPEIRYVSV